MLRGIVESSLALGRHPIGVRGRAYKRCLVVGSGLSRRCLCTDEDRWLDLS